jgi:Na+/H+ antiporter NhaB
MLRNWWPAWTGIRTLNELSVTGGNQFGVTGNSIIIDQNLYNFIVNGNLFNVYESNSGIFFDFTGQNNTIVNNIFVADPSSTGGKGIYVGASTPNGVVSGNVFQSLDTGVYLGGTSGWNVQANSYLAVTHTVSGIGSNKVGVATQ